MVDLRGKTVSSKHSIYTSNRYFFLFNGFKKAKHIFDQVPIVKEFNTIKEGLADVGNPVIVKFSHTDLLSSLYCLIYLENYIKTKLVLDNYVVHEISPSTELLKGLSKQQRKEPLSLDELYKVTDWKPTEDDTYSISGLMNKTLSFNTLISTRYNSVIGIPENLLPIIRQINEKRNELHFLTFQMTTFSALVLGDFQGLINYVENTYEILHNRMVIEGTFSKSLLI